jgi:chromosome partitioning protein
VLTYDPGSRGSTSYVEAAKEFAHRGVALPAVAAPPKPPAPPPPVAAPPAPPSVAAMVLGEPAARPTPRGRHAT